MRNLTTTNLFEFLRNQTFSGSWCHEKKLFLIILWTNVARRYTIFLLIQMIFYFPGLSNFIFINDHNDASKFIFTRPPQVYNCSQITEFLIRIYILKNGRCHLKMNIWWNSEPAELKITLAFFSSLLLWLFNINNYIVVI